MRYIVGIDPSSGSRSSIGFAVIDMQEFKVLYYSDFKAPTTTDLRVRIKSIVAFIIKEFKKVNELLQNEKFAIGIEHTVMLGKGGESLNRAIGAIMAVTPITASLHDVSNVQMKVIAGGHGRADKAEIGKHLQTILVNSKDLLMNLTASSRWDIIDAIGLGVAAHEKFYKKPQALRDTEPKKANKKSRTSRKSS